MTDYLLVEGAVWATWLCLALALWAVLRLAFDWWRGRR